MKKSEKLTIYKQLGLKTRQRGPGYKIYVFHVVAGAFCGGIKTLKIELKKIFDNNKLLDEMVEKMQNAVLMDSGIISRRVMSGLIQGEDNE